MITAFVKSFLYTQKEDTGHSKKKLKWMYKDKNVDSQLFARIK